MARSVLLPSINGKSIVFEKTLIVIYRYLIGSLKSEKTLQRLDFWDESDYNDKLKDNTHSYVFLPLAFGRSHSENLYDNAPVEIVHIALDEFREVLLLTEKDLRKLNRYQLLELLVVQTERADKLQARLDEAQQQLSDRDLKMSSLGSIAEASLQLGDVFQAAQTAADIYLNAAKKHAEEIEENAQKKAAEILAQAQAQARRIKGE